MSSCWQNKALFAEQSQAGIAHIRVVEAIPAALDFVQRLVYAQAGAVGAMGSHGLDDIGYSDNASFQAYGITLEALWIAAAVHAFVVLVRDVSQRPGEIDFLEDIVAGLCMKLDQFQLKRQKLSR